MIKIEYKEPKKIKEELDTLDSGYYLIEKITSKRHEILLITSHNHCFFIDSTDKSPMHCNKGWSEFKNYYTIVGKIKDFNITNITLENDQ